MLPSQLATPTRLTTRGVQSPSGAPASYGPSSPQTQCYRKMTGHKVQMSCRQQCLRVQHVRPRHRVQWMVQGAYRGTSSTAKSSRRRRRRNPSTACNRSPVQPDTPGGVQLGQGPRHDPPPCFAQHPGLPAIPSLPLPLIFNGSIGPNFICTALPSNMGTLGLPTQAPTFEYTSGLDKGLLSTLSYAGKTGGRAGHFCSPLVFWRGKALNSNDPFKIWILRVEDLTRTHLFQTHFGS